MRNYLVTYRFCRRLPSNASLCFNDNNIFILRDFNFPNVNWSNYTSSSNFDSIFIECLHDWFWSQLINVSTRCANGGSTISVPEYVSLSGEFSSDHMIITFEIILPPKSIKPFKRYAYNYKNADFVELRNLLKFVPCDLACEEEDMDLLTAKWMDLFLAAVDDCVPKIKVRSANKAPWIDAEVLKAVRKKERLRKKAKKSSSGQLSEDVGQNSSLSSNGILKTCHLL